MRENCGDHRRCPCRSQGVWKWRLEFPKSRLEFTPSGRNPYFSTGSPGGSRGSMGPNRRLDPANILPKPTEIRRLGRGRLGVVLGGGRDAVWNPSGISSSGIPESQNYHFCTCKLFASLDPISFSLVIDPPPGPMSRVGPPGVLWDFQTAWRKVGTF